MSYQRLYHLGLALVIAVMIAFPNLFAPFFILLVGIVVAGIVKKELRFRWNGPATIFIALYFCYGIGVLFSDYIDLGLKALEYKLSLLLFPIVFSFVPKKKPPLELIGAGFLIGILVLYIQGILHSTLLYHDSKSMLAFMGANFSYIHHPTYTAAFAVFGMEVLRYGWRKEWKWISWRTVIPTVLILMAIQVQCTSLAGLLFFILYATFVFLQSIYQKLGRRYLIGALVLSPLLILAFIRFTPGVKEQLDVSILYINEYMEDPKEFVKSKQTYVGGNETRLIVWTGAYESIKDQPLGYGTGALKPVLSKKLVELGQPNMADKNYDPHNQYFSTTLELGMQGLMILLIALLIPLIVGLKRRSALLVLLSVNLLFNSAFESMLQRQSGIVFYMFWFCLMFIITYGETLKTNKDESLTLSE